MKKQMQKDDWHSSGDRVDWITSGAWWISDLKGLGEAIR
jgi:hypothetical protein